MKLYFAIAVSILIHIGLIGLMATNFQTPKIKIKQTVTERPKINAKAIDSKQVKNLIKKHKQKKRNKELKEKRRLAKIKKAKDDRIKKKKAEAKRKADELKAKKLKEKAEAKALQEALEMEMLEQMEADSAELAEAYHEQKLNEVDKYVVLIRGKIYRNWIAPEVKGYCIYKLLVSPGGLILETKVVEGDDYHCESGKRAIFKSEPLPVSKDPEIFAELKSINLTLDNRNIEQND